jgi:hypothetical protein
MSHIPCLMSMPRLLQTCTRQYSINQKKYMYMYRISCNSTISRKHPQIAPLHVSQ